MKPTKRIMCPDCGRAKMLFETERKANDFIKWNGGDIYVPEGCELRAYYCPSCCGWHISHQRHSERYDSQTDNLIGAFKRSKTSVSRIDKLINRDLFEEEQRKLEKKAMKVYDKIPEETKALGLKMHIKKFLDSYLVTAGIHDGSGRLRGAVYKVFEKDLDRRRGNGF